MKAEFLYTSIADTQGTIRSIDVRAGFLFVILFLPLSMLDKIWGIYGLPVKATNVMTCWIILTIALWATAVIALFRCVVTIDNPARHIAGAPAHGSFYSGDLFKLKNRHIFLNLPVISSRDIDQEKALIPTSATELESELVFEKMKLTYIRSVKLRRFAAAAWLTVLWLVVAGALGIYTKVIL